MRKVGAQGSPVLLVAALLAGLAGLAFRELRAVVAAQRLLLAQETLLGALDDLLGHALVPAGVSAGPAAVPDARQLAADFDHLRRLSAGDPPRELRLRAIAGLLRDLGAAGPAVRQTGDPHGEGGRTGAGPSGAVAALGREVLSWRGEEQERLRKKGEAALSDLRETALTFVTGLIVTAVVLLSRRRSRPAPQPERPPAGAEGGNVATPPGRPAPPSGVIAAATTGATGAMSATMGSAGSVAAPEPVAASAAAGQHGESERGEACEISADAGASEAAAGRTAERRGGRGSDRARGHQPP